jgi:predicted Ser/Thr protein kinase
MFSVSGTVELPAEISSRGICVLHILLPRRRRRLCLVTGIFTFASADAKSQDIANLTGSINFSTISRYGSELLRGGQRIRR